VSNPIIIKWLEALRSTRNVLKSPKQVDPVDKLLAINRQDVDWRSWSNLTKRLWLQFHSVVDMCAPNNLVYIGANNGKKALALNEAFPGLDLYLIEPAPSTFELLIANTADRTNIHCVNVALGEYSGHAEMFVDNFSPASSLLHYEDLAIQEFPFLGRGETATVKILPLDELLLKLNVASADWIIMDVQGYEDNVLRGARHSIQSCRLMISELSFQKLYANSSTFDSVYQFMIQQGFFLHQIVEPIKGDSSIILQIDGVFVRRSQEVA